SAISRSCRILSNSPTTCCISLSTCAKPALLAALFFGDHELQSRPGLVDRADLDVDQPERKRGVAYHDIAEIGRNARRLLWPGDPDRAVGYDGVPAALKLAPEACRPGRKQVDHVERRAETRGKACAIRQVADDVGIGFGSVADKNAKARLDAELLHERLAGRA